MKERPLVLILEKKTITLTLSTPGHVEGGRTLTLGDFFAQYEGKAKFISRARLKQRHLTKVMYMNEK